MAQEAITPKLWFEQIGEAFVQQYYLRYKTNRSGLLEMYHTEGMVTFEDQKAQGHEQIKSVLMSKPSTIDFIITKVDCQPTSSEGIVVLVTGRLKCDDDPPHAFSQMFILVKHEASFYVYNDIFRLSLHDTL